MSNPEIKVSDYLSVAECINNNDNKKRNNSVPDCCAIVHRGRFTDKNKVTHPVAVKKYQTRKSEIISSSTYDRVIETLKFLSLPGNQHPNFIRFFEDELRSTAGEELGERAEGPNPPKKQRTTKDEFRYLITELCVCSVRDLVGEKRVKNYSFGGQGITAQEILMALPLKEILKQSTEAVNFLHGLGLIHRNLHPDNFLIQQITGENQFIIKLTDFQLTKHWEKDINISKSFSWSDWIVPEQDKTVKTQDDERKADEDPKTDVFTMGCYFYYVLTGGNHPFGNNFDARRKHIRDGQYTIYQNNDSSTWNPLKLQKADETERKKAIKLIRNMIRFRPSDRISMWQVLEDEFFYPYQSHYNIYDNVSKQSPGLCVIICQETFENTNPEEGNLSPLTGINNDAGQLRRTFARFGYDVLLYYNLKRDQMINNLKPDQLVSQLEDKTDLSNYASLVVCILSHGDKGVVYGTDCLPVPINHLRNLFSSDKCPEMIDKPKIFIIFACQGNEDQTVNNEYSNDVEMESAAGTNQQVVAADDNKDHNDAGSPPVISNFLFLLSSIEDFKSYFVPGMGSPFTSHLCGAMISEYGNNRAQSSEEEKDKRDLVSLFTWAVAPRLGRLVFKTPYATEFITFKQTPEMRSSLTKTIRFRAKQPTHVIANQIKEEAALLAQQKSNHQNTSALPFKFIYSDKESNPSSE